MCALILSSVLCLPAQSPGADAHAVLKFDWQQFGEQVRKRLPAEQARNPPLTPVDYTVEQVALQLVRLGIAPNHDAAGRKLAAERYGGANTRIGTCGHLSGVLQQALLGAGVSKERIAKIVVAKVRPNGLPGGTDFLNGDHAAIIVVMDSEARVFDLWMEGRTSKTFGKFAKSEWNGMPLGTWVTRMTQEGYNAGRCEGGVNEGDTTIEQVALRLSVELFLRPRTDKGDAPKK